MGTRSDDSSDFGNKTTTAAAAYVVEELPEDDAAADVFFEKNRRCCFWIPTFRSAPVGLGSGSGSSGRWERIRTAEKGGGWWARGFSAIRRVKEWSEVVAGPRWKTFLRRFNRRVRGSRNAKFHYDPLSYARNFDEGHGQDGDFEEFAHHNFSVRYAALPASAKSSMDLGKDPIDFGPGTGAPPHAIPVRS